MFLAHAPAGYLLTRALLRSRLASGLDTRRCRFLVGLGLFASVAPDLDLVWF